MCPTCFANEVSAHAALKATEQERIEASRNATLAAQKSTQPMSFNDLIGKSQKIDQEVRLVQDMYNAWTVALKDLITAINEDATIENKPYARCKVALDRLNHFKSLISELEDKILDAKQGFRVSQEYLNQTVNELRDSEREEFRKADMSYQVKSPKTPKPKSQGTKKVKSSTKVDFTEINKWATIAGISGNAIHGMMIQHGVDAKGAARIMCGLLGKPFPEDAK
jgi:hypothetical protein